VNFCPSTCTFIGPEKANKDDVCESYVLMVECDERPTTSLQNLEELLSTPTMLVKSGVVWTEPKTGEQHDKLHVYWRLTRRARDAKEHEKLFQARVLAMRIVSSDPTATPSCHPLRWPGSWHKK